MNIGDKGSWIFESGAEPHRLELEEEFGWRSQQDFGTLYRCYVFFLQEKMTTERRHSMTQVSPVL